MNEHAECMKEAAFLRQSIAETKASAQNFQKQLNVSRATAEFALKAGENAARKADVLISQLQKLLDEAESHVRSSLEIIGKEKRITTEEYLNITSVFIRPKIGKV